MLRDLRENVPLEEDAESSREKSFYAAGHRGESLNHATSFDATVTLQCPIKSYVPLIDVI